MIFYKRLILIKKISELNTYIIVFFTQMKTGQIILEAIDMVLAQKWVNKELEVGNEFLSQYGLSVIFNPKYDFQRNEYYKNCFAIYQNNSVKNNGRIRISINFPLIEKVISKENYEMETITSIWHEIGHGIIQYLKGLRRKDTQCGTMIFRKKMLSDFKEIIKEEEFSVEEFGTYMAMAHKNLDTVSILNDFLNDYRSEILRLKNQEGGSKWMSHFIERK